MNADVTAHLTVPARPAAVGPAAPPPNLVDPAPVERALAALAAGRPVVVMDDEDRENEGDLIIAAEKCTTEKMAWMIRHTRCVSRDLLCVNIYSSFYPFIFISLGSGICVQFFVYF